MTTAWKTIRVFISSTFKDMQAERDHLVRFVFPRLREELLRWRLHLEDVDLRWGVTTDQDAFDLCMTEIDRCHPRFICVLGGRYGWMPPPREIESVFLFSVLSESSPAGQLAADEHEALAALYAPAENGKHRLKTKPKTTSALEEYHVQGEIAVRVLQRAGFDAATRSITASEIHYGALDRLQVPAFRFFYFRQDCITASIPQPFAKDYREPPDSPAEKSLAGIKQRIKNPGTCGQTPVAPSQVNALPLAWRDYSKCAWDSTLNRIVALQEFGDKVYADLLASVVAEFGEVPPKKEAHTDEEVFAVEREQMEAFIEERTERFVIGSRKRLMDDMLAFAAANGAPNIFVLTGDPGSGKSALLAHFCRNTGVPPVCVSVVPPEAPPAAGETPATHTAGTAVLLPHFIGASTGSTDLRRTLRRLCHELALAAGNTEPLPLDIKDLITHFQKLLTEAAQGSGPPSPLSGSAQTAQGAVRTTGQRIILVFDALNQFDATDGAHWLNWLPRELPPGVRIVASVIAPADGQPEHQTLAILRTRSGSRMEKLKPLTEADTLAIIDGYLKRYSKRLSPEQIAALKEKPAGRLPLYVLTALEELRTLGTYEEITDRIRTLPGDARALFGWILTERLANDPIFGNHDDGEPRGRKLVEKFAACLGVSRHGLSPAELTALLDPGDPLGNVAALLRLLRPYLMRRGELLDFYHGQFREAAGAAHLDTPEKQRAAHQSVATCLQAFADPHRDGQCRDATPHALSELPHHQTRAEAWPDLIATLENIFFLEAKVTHGMAFDLAIDFTAALEALPAERPEWKLLRLLSEALRREIHFIARHAHDYPQALFQCLWNSAWWYDCHEAAPHYTVPEGGWIEIPPWEQPDPRLKLCAVIERWRVAREIAYPGFFWLRSLRPPLGNLGAGQLGILGEHEWQVTSVAYSPDGQRVLSGSWDETIRLWDAQSGQKLIVIRGHRGHVTSSAFSPDGRRVVSGSDDRTVRIWDAQSGEELAALIGHQDMVTSVAFSPDGQCVLSGSWDETIRLWDAQSGRELAVLNGHLGRIRSVCFSPDGRRVLSGAGRSPRYRENDIIDNTLRLWDAQQGREIAVLRGHAGEVTSVAFSPDGRRVLSGSVDKTVRLWDAQSGQELVTLIGHQDMVNSVAFSPDGGLIVSGSGRIRLNDSNKIDNTLRLWEAQSGRNLSVLPGHDSMICAVAFSPNGRQVLSGSGDGKIRSWDVQSGRDMLILNGHWATITELAFSPDGSRVLSGSMDKTVRLWDTLRGQELSVLSGYSDRVNSSAFSPDGRRLLSRSGDKTARLWDVQSGCELAELCGHEKQILCMTFSPDGLRAVSGSMDKTVRLWDVQSGQELACLRGHEGSVTRVVFSPNGALVLSGSSDQTMRLWDARRVSFRALLAGRKLAVLRGHEEGITSIAFSPDGRYVVSGSYDKTVRLWDAQSVRTLAVLPGHTYWVTSVAFSPDGRFVVSGSYDKTVRIWEGQSGREVAVLRGHLGEIDNVVFSPNGRYILSESGSENTVRLWDAKSGECVERLSWSKDLTAIAVGVTAFRWRAMVGEGETVIKPITRNLPIARFSNMLCNFNTHPDGRIWAGGYGGHLVLLRLEGG